MVMIPFSATSSLLYLPTYLVSIYIHLYQTIFYLFTHEYLAPMCIFGYTRIQVLLEADRGYI